MYPNIQNQYSGFGIQPPQASQSGGVQAYNPNQWKNNARPLPKQKGLQSHYYPDFPSFAPLGMDLLQTVLGLTPTNLGMAIGSHGQNYINPMASAKNIPSDFHTILNQLMQYLQGMQQFRQDNPNLKF